LASAAVRAICADSEAVAMASTPTGPHYIPALSDPLFDA